MPVLATPLARSVVLAPRVVEAAAPSPITYEGVGTVFTNANTASWVIDAPDSIASGELLCAWLGFNNTTPTVTPPSGWDNRTSEIDADDEIFSFFTKTAGGSEPSSYTFSLSASRGGNAVIFRVSGADTSDPIDAALLDKATSTTAVAPSVAPSTAGLLICAAWTNATRTHTVPGSMTEIARNNSQNPTFAIAYEALASSGATGTRTFTLASGAWRAMSVVLKD